MIITRRSFLRGLLAAPIIVAAPSLMKVRALPPRAIDIGDHLLGLASIKREGQSISYEIEGFDQYGRFVTEMVEFPADRGELCYASRTGWREVTNIRIT